MVGTVDGNEPAGATAHGASVLLGGAHDSLTIVVAVCQTQEGLTRKSWGVAHRFVCFCAVWSRCVLKVE